MGATGQTFGQPDNQGAKVNGNKTGGGFISFVDAFQRFACDGYPQLSSLQTILLLCIWHRCLVRFIRSNAWSLRLNCALSCFDLLVCKVNEGLPYSDSQSASELFMVPELHGCRCEYATLGLMSNQALYKSLRARTQVSCSASAAKFSTIISQGPLSLQPG